MLSPFHKLDASKDSLRIFLSIKGDAIVMYFIRAVVTTVKHGQHPILFEAIHNSLLNNSNLAIKMRDLSAFNVIRWKTKPNRANKHTWSDGTKEITKDVNYNNNVCNKRYIKLKKTINSIHQSVNWKCNKCLIIFSILLKNCDGRPAREVCRKN